MITTMRSSIVEAIPMTDAQFGLLTSVFLCVYGGLSPFAGYLADRYSICLDGSTAVQTAFRLASAKTGGPKFLRFEGHYHGWLDNVAYGISAPGPLGQRDDPTVYPWTAGLPPDSRDECIVLPWNDLELLRQTVDRHAHELAAIITEPIMCNNGCILPKEGFLEGLREISDQKGITLIFDEVITGFRMGLGEAQAYFGVTPDLSIFAKAMGSGYPISAIVGKQEWMELMSAGKVIHAGTMNASGPTVAAALATIKELERQQPYERMFRLGQQLMEGIRQAAADAGHPLVVQGPGPMFTTLFSSGEAVDYRDTLNADKSMLNRFIAGLHDEGIRVIGRGLWYISAIHIEQDIAQAIEKVRVVLTGCNAFGL